MSSHSLRATFNHSSFFSRKLRIALLVAACLAPVFPANAQPSKHPTPAEDLQAARALSRAFQRVAKQTEPAVVHLTAIRPVDEVESNGWVTRRTGRRLDQPMGFGSGVIVDPSGIVITNNHVVEPGESFRVKLADGREFAAAVVGKDPLTDLAVVRISDAPAGEVFPTAPFGDSDAVEVGDWVMAIGSPFGFTSTVTTGIVSAKSRTDINLPGATRGMYQDFIQTDAAVNPGNSGGPLLDLEGKIIGINSAIATRAGGSEGISFAIPAQLAKAVMDSILKSGRVVRGYVGIDLDEISAARLRQLGVKAESGVLVKEVVEKGPAANAGLRNNDIIVKFNGRPMPRLSTLRAAIALTPPGSTAVFDVVREGGAAASVSVEVGDENLAAAQRVGGVYSDRFGGIVRTIDADIRKQLGRGFGRIEGVIVRRLDALGLAASSEFLENDIIVAVDGGPIQSAEEFKKAIEQANLKEGVRIDVIRNRMRGNIELRQE